MTILRIGNGAASRSLRASLGQSVVVQNIIGAGSTIGTARAIQSPRRLHAERRQLDDPTVKKRLTELGQDIPSRERATPEGFGAFHKSEIAKWWPLIRSANIKVE